jgi:hypothetical protein
VMRVIISRRLLADNATKEIRWATHY